LVQLTPGYALTNLIFGVSSLVCAYNLFRSATLDPGYVSKSVNDGDLKETIDDLVVNGHFDGMNFCLACLVRKPLRSKHCHVCKRCTARHDHHCPWIWNCVGANNHRQFLLFVIFLISGISSFIVLIVAYFTQNAPEWVPNPLDPLHPGEGFDSSCFMPTPLCTASAYDSFALATAFWGGLQLTWTSILIASQLWQVSRQMTTLEVSNLGRYGYMGGRGGQSLASQSSHSHHSHSHSHGAAPPTTAAGHLRSISDSNSEAEPGGHRHGPSCNHPPQTRSRSFFSRLASNSTTGFCLQILGLDRFTKGKAVEGLSKSSKATNPFDMGWWRNCLDFWSRGKELGVEWDKLYDVPPGGFKAHRARMERERDVLSRGEGAGVKPKRMSRRGDGYEQLRMDDV